VEKEEKKVVQ
jgi:hypothetical protein